MSQVYSTGFIGVNRYTSPSTLDSAVVIQDGKANLLNIVCENTSAGTRWCQIFDGYAAPTNGDVPIASFKLGAGSQESFSFDSTNGLYCALGIVIASSTTGPTYTDPSADEFFLTVQWSQ